MGCRIRRTGAGYLAYRLRSKLVPGYQSQERTGLKDTLANRRRLEARAHVIADEMAAGSFDYLKWFPQGAKAALLKPAKRLASGDEVTVGQYAGETWLPTKQPPVVKKWLALTYRKHLRAHILPAFADVLLCDVTPRALENFRAMLTRPKIDRGKGLALKTARDVIDATFRALYRDAREVDQLVSGDPFAALKWGRKIVPEPDPFTVPERTKILDYFRRKDRTYYPLVFTQFWTGMRPGEALGARHGVLDVRTGKLTIRISRSLGEDNPTKTVKSARTITLRPDVVAVLGEMATPLHVAPDAFLFTTQHGTPIEEERFVDAHWNRALQATGIRPRGFYTTRHTFISAALTDGCNLKWLADYCGTSVDMIERHYGKWMGGDDRAQLAKIGEGGQAPSTIARDDGDVVPILRAKPGSARVVSGKRGRRKAAAKR